MSRIGVIGAGPFVDALVRRLDDAVAITWAANPAETETLNGLVFAPTPYDIGQATPGTVLDDMDVTYAWLHDWVPHARAAGRGTVLYVTSLDGICGTADNVLLAQRDSAMLAQARSMAMELGRFGLRSNCLALGPLAEFEDAEGEHLTKNPLRRVGTWTEAAATAAFLLSDDAAHVSGQLLVCAGGADIGRVIP